MRKVRLRVNLLARSVSAPLGGQQRRGKSARPALWGELLPTAGPPETQGKGRETAGGEFTAEAEQKASRH